MASLLRMTAKDLPSLVKKFNYKKFVFVVISADIDTNGKHDNVWNLKGLLPPTKILVDMVNGSDKKRYKEKYIKYLNTPETLVYIVTMLKTLVYDRQDVIMICSKDEAELKYINVISSFLEDTFDIVTYKYKEYIKNPKACSSVDNPKKVKKSIEHIMENVIDEDVMKRVNRKNTVQKIESMSKKELKKFAEKHNVTVKELMKYCNMV